MLIKYNNNLLHSILIEFPYFVRKEKISIYSKKIKFSQLDQNIIIFWSTNPLYIYFDDYIIRYHTIENNLKIGKINSDYSIDIKKNEIFEKLCLQLFAEIKKGIF